MTITQYSAENPDWGNNQGVTDWRNYVPDYVSSKWDTFTAEQRLLLMSWAEELAQADHSYDE